MESPGNDTDLDSRLAERLRQMRTARGWSLDQLAERSGTTIEVDWEQQGEAFSIAPDDPIVNAFQAALRLVS